VKNNSPNWFIGIKLDVFSDDPNDKIESIDFYDLYNEQVYAHFNTSYKKESTDFVFSSYTKESFDEWKSQISLTIPLKKEKFEQIKEINTANHKSLRRFLRAFGFEEYII